MAEIKLIAEALGRVRKQSNLRHAQIVRSSEISRADRELLLATGWLQEIMRGWYMLVRPDVATGDTAAWYANFWDFVRIYLEDRFDHSYCLSSESSLDLHIESPTIPKQVIVVVKQGAGLRKLMHDTSLLMYVDSKKMMSDEMDERQGIRVMSLAYALCKVPPSYFKNNARDAELALRSIQSPADISRIITRYHLKTSAARLIGAYEFLQDYQTAEKLQADLAAVGIRVSPNNPFEKKVPLLTMSRLKSPYAGRIRAMWSEARDTVISHFPSPPGLPKDTKKYIHNVEEIYEFDAYNSLSIEGYQVTSELIDQVKSNAWNPDLNEDDNHVKNALAAKGYFDAFQLVKDNVLEIIQGGNAGKIVKENLQKWYQKLFGPSVSAGIIKPEALIGYRNDRVFIQNSRHAPPPKEAVLDAMDSFFECVQHESHSGVNAVLGHYFFVFIHPYMDGNGRIGRFLMNALLASGGYPWTVVRVQNRKAYISALENTHLDFNMKPFTEFIKAEMEVSKPG